MESFFFNITDTRYKITKIFNADNEHYNRVDISNGVVFLDISFGSKNISDFKIKNLDRMIMISVVIDGGLVIHDKIEDNKYISKKGDIKLYCSSRQNLLINIENTKKSNIFILFVADFVLKRYLTANKNEPIDFLYNKIQYEVSLELLNTQPTDALSLYIIDKIINVKLFNNMNSIRCEHSVIEFLIYRLSLCDMIDKDIDEEEIRIAKKAKDVLLKNISTTPTIHTLAHLCATNDSKLKKVFKKVYRITIHDYIKKLRLEEANILLKEQNLTIGEIAKKVGYKHQGYFSKLFFQSYGVYPKNLK